MKAKDTYKMGNEYPYDGKSDGDWATRAVRGILCDLTDRRGIKQGFYDIDQDVRVEIVSSLADIIRLALTRKNYTTMKAELNLRLAQSAYNAYGDFRNWKAHDGSPMPKWEDLNAPIGQAWLIAVNAVVVEYEKSLM